MKNYLCVLYTALMICILFTTQVRASGRISQINVAGDTVELAVETWTNTTYQVQRSTNLVVGGWVDEGSEFLASSDRETLFVSGDGEYCCYRVIVKMSAAARASGKVSQILPLVDTMELTIESIPGVHYQVQCTSNLTSGVWIDEGLRFAAAADETVREVSQHGDSCWYRVIPVADHSSNNPSEPGDKPPPPPRP